MLANHVFWLQPSVLWLCIVTFNNDAKSPPKWIWCITNLTPARRVTPPWNVYMAKFDPSWEGYPVSQTGLPALTGHPTYHVNAIKLKWENIWTGGLPHLSGLPHLPGVPHLHVNRPLVNKRHPLDLFKSAAPISKVERHISDCTGSDFALARKGIWTVGEMDR